jgi:hypothetical protein
MYAKIAQPLEVVSMIVDFKSKIINGLAIRTISRLVAAIAISAALVASSALVFIMDYQNTTATRLPLSTGQELLSNVFDISSAERAQSDWQKRLNAPTYVKKINDMWFIVDCWHNRVIWSNDLSAPIAEWNTVNGDLAGPHSVEYGAGYYAIEDTDRNAVNFYTFDILNSTFVKQETINLGTRPHRIHFDEQSQSFYVLSSVSQDMHRISVKDGEIALANAQKLPFLEGQYTRSFNIIGDQLLFAAGPKKVTVTSFRNDIYNVQASYAVPPDFYGMNDIYFTGKKYIVTATLPNSFGVVDRLEDLPTMQNQAELYGFEGRPYYVSQYDNALIIPEVAENASIKIFELDASHNIIPRSTIHEFGPRPLSSVGG